MKQEEDDQRIMSRLAKSVGVTITTLERTVPVSNEDDTDSEITTNGDAETMMADGKIQYANGSTANLPTVVGKLRRKNNSKDKWFEDMKSASQNANGSSEMDLNEEEDAETLQLQPTWDDQQSSTQKPSATQKNPKKPVEFQAKLKLQEGTMVGSAGGWSLEIFPGDFVVHRKYGIGKFERTIVVNKIIEEGTPEHREQISRRRKLVRAARKAGWSQAKIKKLMTTFGTEADNDLISRPRVTMLEISYADGIVQVPIEKA